MEGDSTAKCARAFLPPPWHRGRAAARRHDVALPGRAQQRESFLSLSLFLQDPRGWYQHGNIFGAADRLIREKNLPFRRPRRIITHDMLVLSLIFNKHPEFEGRSFAEFFNLLNPYRVQVAHAITEAGTFIDLDKYESMVELAPLLTLLTWLLVRFSWMSSNYGSRFERRRTRPIDDLLVGSHRLHGPSSNWSGRRARRGGGCGDDELGG